MRVTVPSVLFVTQTEPAPAAIADGSLPTPTDPSFRPEAGSIRETTPSGSTIQSDPNAESVGRTLPPKKPGAASGRVKATTVVPRVDLRDAAVAAGHPDGVLRGGERRRRVADRNRAHGLSRGHVDACHALVVEVRDPQPAGARRDRDRSSADRNGGPDRAGRVERDDRVRRDGRVRRAARTRAGER